MCSLDPLLANNREWSHQCVSKDPEFFSRLARQQSPRYLWIGCSDSRVPANEIVGLQPGEIFVHRNVANLVVHSDLNCLSVLQYAVETLKVQQVMVVGHYGCGGVQAVIEGRSTGLADNWLRHVEDVAHKHSARLDVLDSDESRAALLCELNVVEQVANVCRTTVLRRAWYSGQRVEVHGLIYGLHDGRLQRLGESVSRLDGWVGGYARSLKDLPSRLPTEHQTHKVAIDLDASRTVAE